MRTVRARPRALDPFIRNGNPDGKTQSIAPFDLNKFSFASCTMSQCAMVMLQRSIPNPILDCEGQSL